MKILQTINLYFSTVLLLDMYKLEKKALNKALLNIFRGSINVAKGNADDRYAE